MPTLTLILKIVGWAFGLFLLFDLVETLHVIRDELKGQARWRAVERAEREGRVYVMEPETHQTPAPVEVHHLAQRG